MNHETQIIRAANEIIAKRMCQRFASPYLDAECDRLARAAQRAAQRKERARADRVENIAVLVALVTLLLVALRVLPG